MVRSAIRSLIHQLSPFDEEEAAHIAFVKQWIDSGAEIFRTAKPATPDPHLVAYFLLIDQDEEQVLLVDHKKAKLWLPAGGHVEPGEHPQETVSREIIEELGVQADFISDLPFFLTVRSTAGDKHPHTDVSLWYLLKGSIETPYVYDEGEFHRIRWFCPSDIPFDQSDPHMQRVLQKLQIASIISSLPSMSKGN